MNEPPAQTTIAPAQTLPALLEALINRALAARAEGQRIYPARIEMAADEVRVELRVSGIAALAARNPRIELRLRILSTSAEQTVCAWSWGEREGLSRLIGKGISLVPQEMVDDAMRRFLGQGIRLEGERLILHHAELAAHWFGGEG